MVTFFMRTGVGHAFIARHCPAANAKFGWTYTRPKVLFRNVEAR